MGLIERPALCLGTPPAGSECHAEGVVVFVQLRPDQTGRPIIVVVSSCHAHARSVRRWMRETWPHDELDSFSIDIAETVLRELLSSLGAEGVHALSDVGAA